MGQEESRIDPSTVGGFNPKGNAAGGRQPKGKAGAKGQAKRTARSARAARQADDYFVHTDVKDHITPILDDRNKGRQRQEGDLAEEVDINKLLEEFGKKRRDKDDDDDFDLHDLPGGDGGTESDTDDDDDGGERGMYHHDVKRQESELAPVTSPKAHPVAIKGEACVGCVLQFDDLSEWSKTFPVHLVEWYVSTEIGNQTRFQPFPLGAQNNFTIPHDAVGKFIQIQASRRVEDQLQSTHLRHVEGGVFDAHISAHAQHTKKGMERKFVDVKTAAVVGPILISDEWAHKILESLGDGSISVAVKLRDEPVSADNEVVDDSGARELSRKIPALFRATYESVEFQYEQPQAPVRANTTMFRQDWMQRVVAYVQGREAPEEEVQVAEAKGKKKRKRKEGAGGAEFSENEPVKMVTPLNAVQFRPSVSKNTLIFCTEPKKLGFSHSKLTQDLLRFDVDPRVGRDLLLYKLLAFQAALERGEVRTSKWREFVDMGDLEVGKNLLQQHLEVITSKTSGQDAAFEEMPATPWEY